MESQNEKSKIRWNSKVCANCYRSKTRDGNLYCSLKINDYGVPVKMVFDTQTCKKFARKEKETKAPEVGKPKTDPAMLIKNKDRSIVAFIKEWTPDKSSNELYSTMTAFDDFHSAASQLAVYGLIDKLFPEAINNFKNV